jgi:uncharacterized protein
MPVLFLDSSALVKRYARETGTAWLFTLLRPSTGNDVFIASVAGIEVVSAVTRRRRGGSLTSKTAAKSIARVHRDYARRYIVTELTRAIVARAMLLAERYALRGYDAVQLATAVEVNSRLIPKGRALTLISADIDLNVAATAEGLAVDNPNHHS